MEILLNTKTLATVTIKYGKTYCLRNLFRHYSFWENILVQETLKIRSLKENSFFSVGQCYQPCGGLQVS